jgi:hypothetical protein
MKLSILYHPHSESARVVEEFAHDFERRHGVKPDLLSLETREGAALASLYDIVSYPALVVVADSGLVQKFWEGTPLPLMDEVAGYLAA